MRTCFKPLVWLLGVVAVSSYSAGSDFAPKGVTPTKNEGEQLSTFPDRKHGKGELRHEQGLSILTLRGTPAEIGEQFGVLAVKNAPSLDDLHKNFLNDAGLTKGEGFARLQAMRFKASLPADYLTELDAMNKASKRDISLAMFANTVYDLSSTMGCSTLIVEKGRSKSGNPIFGRNFDWLPTRGMREQTVLAVYHPAGKHSFAIVTMPPIIGCISGMNDAGLSCTINEIHLRQSKDKSTLNFEGTPMLLAYRRVLEECGTVAEAEKLLREMKRATTSCLSICDKDGGAVFEITPKTVVVRTPTNDVCSCTNHFQSDTLGIPQKCWRADKLDTVTTANGKLGVNDVFSQLDDVNQGKNTIQSMVFEPAERRLHLKVGSEPATKLDAKVFDLGKLFDAK